MINDQIENRESEACANDQKHERHEALYHHLQIIKGVFQRDPGHLLQHLLDDQHNHQHSPVQAGQLAVDQEPHEELVVAQAHTVRHPRAVVVKVADAPGHEMRKQYLRVAEAAVVAAGRCINAASRAELGRAEVIVKQANVVQQRGWRDRGGFMGCLVHFLR